MRRQSKSCDVNWRRQGSALRFRRRWMQDCARWRDAYLADDGFLKIQVPVLEDVGDCEVESVRAGSANEMRIGNLIDFSPKYAARYDTHDDVFCTGEAASSVVWRVECPGVMCNSMAYGAGAKAWRWEETREIREIHCRIILIPALSVGKSDDGRRRRADGACYRAAEETGL